MLVDQGSERPAQTVMARLRSRPDLGSEELVAVVRAAQEQMNAWSAVQLFALAQLAATEEVQVDGVWQEQHRGLGHTRLDAAALVSEDLGLTDAGATERVALAVRLATSAPEVLSAVERGDLDSWRANVIVREVEGAAAEVAKSVTAAVVEQAGDRLRGMPAGRLRAVTRRALNRVDPQLVRARQAQARADRDLRRWCDVGGQDVWEVRLTMEQARPAYAAVDAKARELRLAEPHLTLGQARADGLVALVLGRSVAKYVVQVAVPAAQLEPDSDCAAASGLLATPRPCAQRTAGEVELVEVTGLGAPSGTTAVPRVWLAEVMADPTTVCQPVSCHESTGSLRGALASGPPSAVDGYVPSTSMKSWVRHRDGSCRFPGCTISARFCDLDHVRPWPTGPTAPANLMCLCRRHHRVKQRPGWSVSIADDATVTWVDPCGRQRVTLPVDHLRRADAPSAAASGPSLASDLGARTEPSERPWSPRDLASGGAQSAGGLEHQVEWHLARSQHAEPTVKGRPLSRPGSGPVHRPQDGSRGAAELRYFGGKGSGVRVSLRPSRQLGPGGARPVVDHHPWARPDGLPVAPGALPPRLIPDPWQPPPF